MSTANTGKNQITRQFQVFWRRFSRRKQWNMLFSGLIVVFALWLLARMLGPLLALPEITSVANALLLLGIGYTMFKVYITRPDRRAAAYVFDRFHGLNGMFLTLESLQVHDAVSDETERMLEALAGRIRERLPDEPVGTYSFPTARASACLLLLLMGVALPDTPFVSSSFTTDETEKHQTRKDIRDAPNSTGTKSRAQSVTEVSSSDKKFEQLMDRFDRLQQKRTNENTEAHMAEKRELKKDMSSYLTEQDRQTSSEASGASTKSSGTSAQPGEGTSSSQSRPGSGSGSTGSGDDTGSDVQDPNRQEQRSFSSRERDQTRTIKRAIRTLETAITRSVSSDNRGSTANSPTEQTASDVPLDTGSQDVATMQDSGSFRVNWDRMGEAVRRPRNIQNWPPRYDRSISRYRSRLVSFVSSKNQNHGTDQ